MDSNKKTHDIIVVGAGTGGSTAARVAAEKGLKVCLIDSKEKSQIGNKICGDAVGTEIFEFLEISPPKGDELSCHIKGGKLYSPDMKKCMTLTDPKQAGYIVNRLEFGQRLLEEALDAGVDYFIDTAKALELIYSQKKVSGVKVKLLNGDKIDLKSKLVIDASGFYSPLRRKINSPLIENEINKADSIVCYREIVEFPKKDQQVENLEYITIILDQLRAPGGYIWYFPKNENTINIGLGVYMQNGAQVKELYKKNVFNEFVHTSNYKIISSGGGVVPVRRPLWSCADDGIMFIGDAACQVNPLHGGGIDPSMRAGYYAALTASKALSNGDYSLNQLWDYNTKIMHNFGAEFAALDLLRIVLQKLTNESLNFGFGRDILTSNEILQICSEGRVDLTFFDMANKALKGIFNPKLMFDLNYLRIKMNEISGHYRKFPVSPFGFENWKETTNTIYEKIRIGKFG